MEHCFKHSAHSALYCSRHTRFRLQLDRRVFHFCCRQPTVNNTKFSLGRK